MDVPPLQDGVDPLDILGRTWSHLQTGSNILRVHLSLALRFHSEQLQDGPRQGTGRVPVMVQLASEGSALFNHLERLI